MYRLLKYRTKTLGIGQRNLLSCWFKVEKFRSDGIITYSGPWFHNVILDVGLDLFAGNALYNMIRECNVGTGTSSPATGQSGLDSYLANSNTTYSVTHHTTNTDPLFFGKQETIEFAVGSCTGNLTEVGLSKDANSEYFNRQLFRDETDTPITITVASDEGLRVTFAVRMYATMDREVLYPGSFDLSGTTVNFDQQINHEIFNDYNTSFYSAVIHKFLRGGSVKGGIDDGTSAFIGTGGIGGIPGAGNSSHTTATYLAGNFYRDTELVWAPNDFSGDINRIMIGYDGSGSYDATLSTFLLDSPISVLDTEELVLNIRRSWGRYTP